jgi:hypothetical protein
VHERAIAAQSRHGSQTLRSRIRMAGIEEVCTSGALWQRRDSRLT